MLYPDTKVSGFFFAVIITTFTALIPTMKKVVIIDNYDSFTYNLVHYLEALDCEVTVFRNDEFELHELASFDKILLSPGPGLPSDAGLLKQVITAYAQRKSILGVCLGLQAIAEVFGGKLLQLNHVHHGVASTITIQAEDELYSNLPKKIQVGRYHSWVMDPENIPNDLTVTAVDENNEIMSIKHNYLFIRGVQFHPESILTPHGKTILKNWLALDNYITTR